MKIKAQLAFALSYGAKLFLFDEPTAGLDKHFRDDFLRLCTKDNICVGRQPLCRNRY